MTIVDRLLLLVAGLAIDALFGEMPAIFRHANHPVALAGRAITFFDRKLNREARSEAARRGRGIITVVFLVGASGTLGFVVERLCHGNLLGSVVETLLVAILVA
jgi:adenosylcobinamide-phosphate synthase